MDEYKLAEANTAAVLKDMHALAKSLKVELIKAMQYFFQNHGNLVAELMFVHRTTEYNDEGSELFTGNLNFKPTDVLKYMLPEGETQDNFLLYPNDYREDFKEYHPIGYNFSTRKSATSALKKAKASTQVIQLYSDMTKLQQIFNKIPDHVFGDMFGEDKMIIIKSNGEITMEHFDAWDY